MADEIVSLADKVIAILKQKKIVEFADLVKETGADEKDLKHIINILEEEEMVDVGYSLTKILISWNDEADRILMKMKKSQKVLHMKDLENTNLRHSNNSKEFVDPNEDMDLINDEEPKFNILKEIDEEKNYENHKVNKSSLTQKASNTKKEEKSDVKRESTHFVGGMAVKASEVPKDVEKIDEDSYSFEAKSENIIRRRPQIKDRDLEKKDKKGKKNEISEIDKEIKEIERNILLRISGEDEQAEDTFVSLEESDIVKKATSSSQEKTNKDLNSRTKQKVLNKYRSNLEVENSNDENEQNIKELQEKLDQILKKKEEIAELNKQKTILFDNSYPELKSKLSTQIEAMQSIIAEKEGRLKELKNKIEVIPQDIREINEILKSFKESQEKLNASFNLAMNQINEIRAKMQEAKEEYSSEFVLIKEQIIEQEKELIKIGNIYSSLKEKEERLTNSINFIKENIAKSQGELLNLEDQLDRFREASKSIEMKIEETNRILRALNRQFEKHIEKMREFDIIEEEAKRIQNKYLEMKEKIDSKIHNYENEILALSKSIELEASTKYLEELEKMIKESEISYNSLLLEEKRINDSIEEKKKELFKLIEEAKAIQNSINSKETNKIYIEQDLSNSNLDLQNSRNYKGYEEMYEVEVKTIDSKNLDKSESKSKVEEIKDSISRLLDRISKKK